MKQYKFGGSKGHWFISFTEDGNNWKTTNFQYKVDAKRFEKCLQEQGYTLLMNIKKYLDNVSATENGYVYKREDYDTAPDDEIVYIGEFDLDTLQKFCDDGEDLTDNEIIEKSLGDSRNTIRQTIKVYLPNATDEWIDKHNLIDDIIQSCTWECPATMIDQMDDWDIWVDYPEK